MRRDEKRIATAAAILIGCGAVAILYGLMLMGVFE